MSKVRFVLYDKNYIFNLWYDFYFIRDWIVLKISCIKWVQTSCTNSPFFCLFLIFFILNYVDNPPPPSGRTRLLGHTVLFYVSVYYIRGLYYVIYTSPYLHSFFSFSFIQGLFFISIKFFLCLPFFPMKH